ncbi:hypothetical protein [Chitiniphilus eburneus]|uniref:hypothetical protein n=1 Tax=Chitiniphilus eburneus TaxID=2571148 RepID=UPI0035D12FCC
MTMCHDFDLRIRRGATFRRVLQWASEPVLFLPVSGLAATPPARLTVPGHGLPDGWYVAVVSLPELKGLNATQDPPSAADYRAATVLDADTLEFDGVNSAGWTLRSNGYLRAYTPVPLAGCIARMAIKDRVGGLVLLEMNTGNGGIVLDDIAKTITLSISASDTAALAWKRGVYDLEIESADGTVTLLAEGNVRVGDEVTT